ncbi:MAG: hypothetical protein PVG65_00330 [Candidatus Thorarchaeota archaeon]|jgi:hypothetical protein
MKRNKKNKVRDIRRAYAHNQKFKAKSIKKEYENLARKILNCQIEKDILEKGITHFYSPRGMPWKGDENKKHIKRLGNASFKSFDTKGGTEKTKVKDKKGNVIRIIENYKPGWALKYKRAEIEGVREFYFKFHRQPGGGRVE